MNNKNTEDKLKGFFAFQEQCFELPEKNKIKAFQIKPEKTDVKNKNPGKIRYISLIAACLAIIICATSAFILFKNPEITPSIKEIEYFGEVKTVEGIAQWYEPKTLEVETHFFEGDREIELKASSKSAITLLSARPSAINNDSEDNIKEFPSWVTGTQLLNERYIALLYDNDDAEKIIAKYNSSFILYDIEKDEIFGFGDRIYNMKKDFFDSFNAPNPRGFMVEEFGSSEEWCTLGIFDYTEQNDDGEIHSEYRRFIFNIESGEVREIPTRQEEAIASDYSYIIYVYQKGEYNGNEQKVITILNTETMEEKIIPGLEKTLSGVVFTRADDRYVLCYLFGERGWDTPYAKWYIYDTQTDRTQYGEGEIIYFLPEKDAIITRTTSGGRIYRMSDMADITDSFELETYQYYELQTDLNKGVFSMHLEPLFGEATRIQIAEKVATWVKWEDYYYIYCFGASVLLVYSPENNEMFEYDLSDTGITKCRYHALSINILDNGKKCSITTVYYPDMTHEFHYDPYREGDPIYYPYD